jgi:hypothetical protein
MRWVGGRVTLLGGGGHEVRLSCECRQEERRTLEV